MPGLARVQPTGEPSLSGPDHTLGETMISTIELTTPKITPVTAPAVLNRRQIRASRSAGAAIFAT